MYTIETDTHKITLKKIIYNDTYLVSFYTKGNKSLTEHRFYKTITGAEKKYNALKTKYNFIQVI